MAKKKKKKKHIIAPKPKGPQSEKYKKSRKKVRLKLGLNDEALYELGYRYRLSKYHKGLFVASICLLLVPFWFMLENKKYATSKFHATRAFVLLLFLMCLILTLIFFWKRIF